MDRVLKGVGIVAGLLVIVTLGLYLTGVGAGIMRQHKQESYADAMNAVYEECADPQHKMSDPIAENARMDYCMSYKLEERGFK